MVTNELTPLNGTEHGGFKRLWKPCMQCSGFLLLTLERLKVVETALARHLALKLFELVEGETGGI